jgi:hypothetical protein
MSALHFLASVRQRKSYFADMEAKTFFSPEFRTRNEGSLLPIQETGNVQPLSNYRDRNGNRLGRIRIGGMSRVVTGHGWVLICKRHTHIPIYNEPCLTGPTAHPSILIFL